jgi:hypothetical protein
VSVADFRFAWSMMAVVINRKGLVITTNGVRT